MLCYIPLVPLQEASALTTCPHVSNVHAGETRTQSGGQRHTLWHDATLPAWPAQRGLGTADGRAGLPSGPEPARDLVSNSQCFGLSWQCFLSHVYSW